MGHERYGSNLSRRPPAPLEYLVVVCTVRNYDSTNFRHMQEFQINFLHAPVPSRRTRQELWDQSTYWPNNQDRSVFYAAVFAKKRQIVSKDAQGAPKTFTLEKVFSLCIECIIKINLFSQNTIKTRKRIGSLGIFTQMYFKKIF